MKVILSPKAERQLKKLNKIDQIALARKIRSIGKQKDISGEGKIKGFKNIFRVRVGNIRIVYRKNKKIYIILIRHRRDVYRLLRNLLK